MPLSAKDISGEQCEVLKLDSLQMAYRLDLLRPKV